MYANNVAWCRNTTSQWRQKRAQTTLQATQKCKLKKIKKQFNEEALWIKISMFAKRTPEFRQQQYCSCF